MFGGYRRARVSSQCFKRAVRLHASSQQGQMAADWGVRTKKLKQLLVAALKSMGRDNADERIVTALEAAGLKLGDDGKTEYLLFLGRREIDAFAKLIDNHWDALAPADSPSTEKAKRSKKEAKAAAPEEVVKAAKKLLDGGKALDVALFGRMLADLPQANQHAACQVAHAISTHRVEREFDYFTAVDDEGTEDETGAGMIGALEFNSATFYRYAALDAHKLLDNLDGDRELTLKGIAAFAEAMVRAIPTGKQNTFAAHNPPSFVGVVLRHASPFNLANAFEKPVVPLRDRPLTAASVEALADCEQRVARLYGDARDAWAVLDDTGRWPAALGTIHPNLPALVEWLRAEVDRWLPAADGA
jgi:CRISPR system Cascade subunit CasC